MSDDEDNAVLGNGWIDNGAPGFPLGLPVLHAVVNPAPAPHAVVFLDTSDESSSSEEEEEEPTFGLPEPEMVVDGVLVDVLPRDVTTIYVRSDYWGSGLPATQHWPGGVVNPVAYVTDTVVFQSDSELPGLFYERRIVEADVREFPDATHRFILIDADWPPEIGDMPVMSVEYWRDFGLTGEYDLLGRSRAPTWAAGRR